MTETARLSVTLADLAGDSKYRAALAAMEVFTAAAGRFADAAGTVEAELTTVGFDRDPRLMTHICRLRQLADLASACAGAARTALQAHAPGAEYHERGTDAGEGAFRGGGAAAPTGWAYHRNVAGQVIAHGPDGERGVFLTQGTGLRDARHPADMPKPLYHGSCHLFGAGDLVEPGRNRQAPPVAGQPYYYGTVHEYCPGEEIHHGAWPKYRYDLYTSTDPSLAAYMADLRSRQRNRTQPGRLYEVRPTGPLEPDDLARPCLKGDISWMTKHPLHVVREIPRLDWPEDLSAWRDDRPYWEREPAARGSARRAPHVYMTESIEGARRYAGPTGYVYEVQPTGWYGHRRDAHGAEWATSDPVNIVRVFPAGPLYHGSRYQLRPGDVLTGGAKPPHNAVDPGPLVYVTTVPRFAAHFGHHANPPPEESAAEARVYQVEPLDGMEADPFEDPFTGSYRSRRVRIVREVDWRDLPL